MISSKKDRLNKNFAGKLVGGNLTVRIAIVAVQFPRKNLFESENAQKLQDNYGCQGSCDDE
jgi:hypothetical protein